MANPQRENGHVDIANELVEVLAKTRLSGYESRVLWALWRKTWGWVKKDDKGKIIRDKKGQPLKLQSAAITSKEWEKLTGLNKYNISRTLRELNLRQIVIKFDNKNRWGFQKDYDQWLQPFQKVVIKYDNDHSVIKNDNEISKNDNEISKNDNKIISKSSPDKGFPNAKETLKETLKETIKIKGNIFINTWKDFKEMRTKIKKPMTKKAEELLINKLDRLTNDKEEQIAILNQSIMNSWQGVFPLKDKPKMTMEEALKKMEVNENE